MWGLWKLLIFPLSLTRHWRWTASFNQSWCFWGCQSNGTCVKMSSAISKKMGKLGKGRRCRDLMSLLLRLGCTKILSGGHAGRTYYAGVWAIFANIQVIAGYIQVIQQDRESAFVFLQPGLYKSMKSKWAKSRAHWSWWGFKSFTVFSYSLFLWSVNIMKGWASPSHHCCNSSRPCFIASNSCYLYCSIFQLVKASLSRKPLSEV